MRMQQPTPLLELVPNVSIGRDRVLVSRLAGVVRAAMERADDGSRAVLADVHVDDDHDRSVFTMVGHGEALATGMEALARAAIDAIDLHDGHGVHPRVGVVDVVPVVALDDSEAGRAAAQLLAGRIAATLGDELQVPCIRYGLDAAGRALPGAGSTGAVRTGGIPRIEERVALGKLTLAAGPAAAHPTAGITLVGVRPVLIAFNVDLEQDELDSARDIAREIRDVTKGPNSLPGVRALGLRLPLRTPPITQVSTNIERHQQAGPARVLMHVARIAQERGLRAARAELVGLAPDSALAPLRYACTSLGLPLAACAQPSLDEAIRRAAGPQLSPPQR